MIFTDGEIMDMEETKRKIIEASFLPISLIIVGIGDFNFRKMEVLDADNGLLSC